MQDPRAFAQFRRLVLGIVVETLSELRVDVDLPGLVARFEPTSGFRMTWVDNWMCFAGEVSAPLRAPLDAEQVAAVEGRLRGVWPEIVEATHALPLADRFSITRNDVTVEVGAALRIRFHLEAD